MVVGLTLPLAILVEGHPVERTKYHPLLVEEVYFLQSKAREPGQPGPKYSERSNLQQETPKF